MPGFIDQYFLGYATIQTNGAPLPQRATLNFLGFTVQDDPINNVTKVLGGSSGGTSGTLVGDVTTATTISGPTAATVVGLQGRTVASAAPADTYVLTWSAAHAYWYPASSSSQFGYLTTDVTTSPIAGATVASVLQAAAGFKVYNGATTLMTFGNTGAAPQILFESGGYIQDVAGGMALFAPSAGSVNFGVGAGGGILKLAPSVTTFTNTNTISIPANTNFSFGVGPFRTVNTSPHYLQFVGESSNAGSTVTPNGGAILFSGGSAAVPGVTGVSGAAALTLNAGTAIRGVEVAEVAVQSRGVALAQMGGGVTSTNVPSGDGWVWIAKAAINPGVPTGGFVLYGDASTGAAYCCNPGGSPFPLGAGGGTAASSTGWYGGGEDGAIVLNGTNTYPIFQLANPGTSATYAPYSDVYATTLVVNAGITLSSGPNGCQRILADVSIVNNGTIDCGSGKPGQPGSGSSAGGNAIPAGTLGGSWAGASGGVGLAQGGGVAPTGTNVIVISLTGPLQGGGGGASSATSGGSGGGVSSIATRPFAQPSVATGFACPGSAPAYMVQFTGGTGGGGGGSTGASDAGGGGGSSAGIGALLAPTITNNGVIRSLGGNGGAGFAGTSNAGGGGGGAGGVILITTNSGVIIGNAPVVTGGTGGAGAGPGGVAGQNGTNGKIIYSQP